LLNNEEDYMHTDTLKNWKHDHTFGQELKKPGENRTWIVIALTGSMMVIEIIAGIIFGSMALLADGLHMASHAVALAINAFAYLYARRHAADSRFSFGTGKVNALGGFTGAILLAGFAAFMAFESIERLFNPVEIQFMNAIIVAGIGLAVNGASVFILGDHHGHDHDHEHDHHHGHSHDHDHNLRSAYFHVLADALTSFTAIFALLAGKYLGAAWMDPVMGIVGSLLVANWSRGLLRDTSGVLLDRQVDEEVREKVVQSIEQLGDEKVADLHLWSIGPNIYNANLALVTHNPKSPDYYKEQLPDDIGLVHSTIEVHRCE
jgi:cation diffusion facilitator family transporter